MCHIREHRTAGGFTLAELVVVVGIIGLLAAVVGPRFLARGPFESLGFFDRATQTIRYAQKVSVAWRRPVFVCVTASTISAGLTADCTPPLDNPATGAALSAQAPGGVTIAGSTFSFIAPTATLAGGQPSTGAQVVFTLNSTIPGDPARRIVIERETGYVHN